MYPVVVLEARGLASRCQYGHAPLQALSQVSPSPGGAGNPRGSLDCSDITPVSVFTWQPPCVHNCVQCSLFKKETSPSELGPTLLPLAVLAEHIGNDPVSK